MSEASWWLLRWERSAASRSAGVAVLGAALPGGGVAAASWLLLLLGGALGRGEARGVPCPLRAGLGSNPVPGSEGDAAALPPPPKAGKVKEGL